jgi:hypothetical protein
MYHIIYTHVDNITITVNTCIIQRIEQGFCLDIE